MSQGDAVTRTNKAKDTVIHRGGTPADSVGWANTDFFKNLGSPKNKLGSEEQQSELVYLLMNMVKGAMIAASDIASRYNVGIAVRGTNIRSHQGIESGDPTKAVEFKNKTANEVDLLLCDQMNYADLGTVVHFDPRIGWTPRQGESAGRSQVRLVPGTPTDWTKKKAALEAKLKKSPQGVFVPKDERSWGKVKGRFEQRIKEYLDEDHGYRPGGCYSSYASISGIHLRIKISGKVSDKNMVGDHDLFGFTDPKTHQFINPDKNTEYTQTALQLNDAFQAQHGGIWYWNPPEGKNIHIKNVIMGAHGPDKDEPLLYFADGRVMAMFYVKGTTGGGDLLKSVWDYPGNKRWQA